MIGAPRRAGVIVGRMRSLANLLEAAVRRSATEVLLESGQPVVFTTTRGPVSEQSVLPRTELFDMIVAVVDDAQQVELAVGNPVEFTIEAGVRWSVFAEPGMEGMTVRAQREGAASDLEVELEPDGFEPGEFRPAGFGDSGLPVDDDDEFEVGLGDDFGAAASGPRPRSPSQAPPSQLYVEALDAPSLQESDGDFRPRPSASPAAPFESGTWALADEEDFGLDGPDEDQLPTGFPEPASPTLDDANIGVPDDDDDAAAFERFDDTQEDLRPRPLSPTVRAMDAASPRALASSAAPRPKLPPNRQPPVRPSATRRPSQPEPAAADAPVPRGARPPSSPHSVTRKELSSLGAPDADTRRELPSVGRGGSALGELAASIAEGSLVFVQGLGLADSLAESFAAPSVIVDDQVEAHEAWTRIRGLPPGAIVIVRREDPSALLGWILRRLEEGYRVLIESRTRSFEGARRILLGVGASERAERWLDAQVVLTIEPGEAGPRLRRAN